MALKKIEIFAVMKFLAMKMTIEEICRWYYVEMMILVALGELLNLQPDTKKRLGTSYHSKLSE